MGYAMQRFRVGWGLISVSYEPRKYHNPVFEEIERNFGFDERLLELDRVSHPRKDEDQLHNERP